MSLLNLNVSIVFDSAYQEGGREKKHYKNLEIFFSSQGETADDYILSAIKSCHKPRQETVVTSDRQLAWLCRLERAHITSVEEFIYWLKRACDNKNRQVIRPVKSLSNPSILTQTTPDSFAEAKADDLLSIFESRWQEALKEEQQLKEIRKLTSPPTQPPRKPKKAKKLFPDASIPEVNASNENERWLKLFEQESSQKGEK